MGVNRRDFLKLAGAGAGIVVASNVLASEHGSAIDNKNTLGVLVDTAVCIGCRKCEFACDQQNKLSDRPLPEFEDKSVFNQHRRPDRNAFTVVNQFAGPALPDKKYFIKVQCMHCNRPACVSACIVGALRKEPNGPVTYDAWKCIGCRYCMVACPFQIPAYQYDNALDPKVMKCTFCFERVTKDGQKPACAALCPNEALTFGTREELLEIAHSRIINAPGKYVDHVYGEFEAGGTSWMYLSPVDFKYTELPQLRADVVPPDKTEPIQHGIFKDFVPPLALYGLLGLIMYTQRETKDKKESA